VAVITETPTVPVESPAAAAGRSLTAALAVVSASVCALAVVFVAANADPDETAGRAVLELLVVGMPLAAGLYAIGHRYDVRFGSILVGAGLAWSLTALGESDSSWAYSTGRVAAWLVFPWLIYLMLAFPDGRIAGRVDRGLFVSLNAVLALLFVGSALFVSSYPSATPWATCRDDCPANAFMVLDREPAVMHDVVQPAREILAVLLFIAVAVSMARRWRASTPLRRQMIGPVMLAAGASVVALAAFFIARERSPDSNTATTLGVVWSLCIPAIAAAFFAGLIQRRLQLGRVLAPLGALLGTQSDTRRFRDAVASSLRDPQLEVLVPDGPGHWRDSRGRAADLVAAGVDGRSVTLIRDDGVPGVALVHDAQLKPDDEIVRAVGALALATLRHERVKARLASSLTQLETSRRRIARAADMERARIERDLHDGAQQRLIALRVRLSLTEELLRRDPEAGAAAVVELGEEVDQTLDELRSLAHGVYPSMLRDRGIGEALRGVAAQAPVPVRVLTFGLTAHSTDVDTAVYFTCVEALQNAIKHAPTATIVRITLRQTDVLTVEVRDDGPGFEPRATLRHDGDGLRNMRDRIEAVGGSLTIESAPGKGTRILAWVPLG
jgi:signal transduction histidine kinase